MIAYVQALGDDVWVAIENGWIWPSVTIGEGVAAVTTPIARNKWNETQKTLSSFNSKGLNAIFTAMSPNEFRRISSCTTSKEAWDKLCMTHEGDKTVKESKLELLTTQFETLRMEESESFDDFFVRLQDIINNSQALGLNYPHVQIVRKILRSLPKRFRSRKDAIQEAHDLKTMSVDTLAGKLKTFEFEMEKPKNEKTLAFKGTSLASKSRIFSHHGVSHDSDSDDDIDREIEQVSKEFQRLIKRKHAMKSDLVLGKKTIFNKTQVDMSKVQCFKCKEYGHYSHNCPTKTSSNYEKKKSSLKVTWDDSGSDCSTDCLNATCEDDDLAAKVVAFTSSIHSHTLPDFSDDVSVHGSTSLDIENVDWEDMYASTAKKYVKLGKAYKSMSAKVEILDKEKTVYVTKLESLESEFNSLEMKFNSTMVDLEHTKADLVSTQEKLNSFYVGSENLDKMLGVEKLQVTREVPDFLKILVHQRIPLVSLSL
ncbi:hypothetical protein IFM89_018256 [Coptis chinensis]|uniref:CCHC-type domain-containing protein n=1 Tax=Coptis chinensis TaxID=261450 RepID=A0A835GZY6_9MAGN|nr:hypothetical protein IFM89_018256 [Coptis chinensis]